MCFVIESRTRAAGASVACQNANNNGEKKKKKTLVKRYRMIIFCRAKLAMQYKRTPVYYARTLFYLWNFRTNTVSENFSKVRSPFCFARGNGRSVLTADDRCCVEKFSVLEQRYRFNSICKSCAWKFRGNVSKIKSTGMCAITVLRIITLFVSSCRDLIECRIRGIFHCDFNRDCRLDQLNVFEKRRE